MELLRGYSLLVQSLSDVSDVLSIGKSGGEALPLSCESDIDLFVLCGRIPDISVRRAVIQGLGDGLSHMRISEGAGRFWGVCDFATLGDADICLMYFTQADMDDEIASVLSGARPDREGEYFYPTGRCATLLSMHVLYDKNGYIAAMKEKLAFYPPALAVRLFKHHIGKTCDEEDFDRAVARGDVLFYHATLESALDHFLQALFALNRCFFPSRKRTAQYIGDFHIKPHNCAERLLDIVALGASPGTLPASYAAWRALRDELSSLALEST